MFYLPSLLFIVFSLCSVDKPIDKYKYSEIDPIFVSWNNATFQSLNRQILLATDSAQRNIYENRFLAIKEFLKVENKNEINTESVRYRFLKELLLSFKKKKKNFYVVESNRSGAGVELRNFVLFTNSMHKVEIRFYSLLNDKWQRIGSSSLNNFYINNELKKYVTKYPLGFNYEDIIITKFENNYVKDSEYYLSGTLSSQSGIKEVLDTYKKENIHIRVLN